MIVIIVLSGAGFIFLRRRKIARATAHSSPTDVNHEKPELTGSRYDPNIAGPVKPKPELSAPSAKARSELKNDGDLAPVAASARHELYGESAGNQLGDETSNKQTRKDNDRHVAQGQQPMRPLDGPPVASQAASSSTEVAEGNGGQYDEDLVAEADLLVQELGLIQARKKVLEKKSAAARASKPEDGGETENEDYKELVSREVKLRKRMEEIEKERGELV